MEFDKTMLVRKEYEMYPNLMTKGLGLAGAGHVNIEGREIERISIGKTFIFFYLLDGTKFKVKLEK